MSQQSSEQDSSFSIVVLALIVSFLAYYLLTMYSYVFVDIWRQIRLGQLYLVSWFPFDLSLDESITVTDLIDKLSNTTGKELSGIDVKRIDSYITPLTSWFPALIIYYLYRKMVGSDRNEGLVEKFSMEGILRHNAKIFPNLKPYVNFHPEMMEDLEFDRTDEVKLQFLGSISPVKFALMSPPLGLEIEAEKNSAFMDPIWDGENGFDSDLAERAFKKQLGEPYSGLDNMSTTEIKMYDILMPMLTFNRVYIIDFVKNILTNIAENEGEFISNKNIQHNSSQLNFIEIMIGYYAEQKLKIERVKKFKKLSESDKHKATAELVLERKNIRKLSFSDKYQINYLEITGERIMNSHSYVRTGMMSILEQTRKGGVVAPNQFNWVKGEDRVLWYCINSVGKKVSFTESGGAYAHWIIECHIGRSIPQPEVSEAVESLKLQLFIDKRTFEKNKNKELDI
jgi:hypothetical protein